MSNFVEILRNHGLKSTPNRALILEIFYNNQHALSQNDIENLLEKKLDRVTVYRTIKSFLEKSIIHEIATDETQMKYALCNTSECSKEPHSHNHIHFKCNLCSKTYCLNHTKTPSFNLPEGYLVNEINILVQGKCSQCS